MSYETRSSIAVSLCLLSMLLATIAITHGASWWLSVELVSAVWFFAGLWLGRQLRRLRMTPRELYGSFRKDGHAMPFLPQLMYRGGVLVGLANIVLLFFKTT